MDIQSRKTIAAILIIVVVVLISTIVTAVSSSSFYQNIPEFDAWTPLPSKTQPDTPSSSEITESSNFTAAPERSTVTPSPDQTNQDCTYPPEYWKDHVELWPQQMVIGEITYSRENINQILRDQSVNVRNDLILQLYFAYLNSIYNADSTAIDSTITDVNRWLKEHSSTDPLSETDLDDAEAYVWKLYDFNIGLIGPGPCPPYKAYTPTPSKTPSALDWTATPTPSATLTPTRYFVTYIPTATATKTDKPDRPTEEVKPPPKPSATSKPAPKPTQEPTKPPEPTEPPQPPTPTPAD